MNRQLLILFSIMCLSCSVFAEERPHHLTFGGLVRMGGFGLTESAKQDLATSVEFKGDKLEDALGKFLMVNYTYGPYGAGIRWMSYALEGESSELEQKLDLEYIFVTASYAFLEGNFLHPRLDSRIGLAIGAGQNQYKLSTKSNSALTSQTVSESASSSAGALISELFFDAIARSGFGYRLGYILIHSVHSNKINNSPLDGSSEPYGYMTITWRY